jgi:7-cyano-7-deazaguanine tRNA-ribosyltransferase
MRAHGHPALFQALERLKKYENYIEKHDPATKNSGLFFFNSIGLARPEIVRYKKRLAARYTPPSQVKTLLLLPQTRRKPFHKSKALMDIARNLRSPEHSKKLHVCFYGSPFSIVPIELDEVYPLSQHETALSPDNGTSKNVATDLAHYISRAGYERVVLLNDPEKWGKSVLNACKKTCTKRKIKFRSIDAGKKQERKLAGYLKDALRGDINKP